MARIAEMIGLLLLLLPQDGIEDLVKRLTDERAEVRVDSEDRLVAMGKAALPRLEKLIEGAGTELKFRLRIVAARIRSDAGERTAATPAEVAEGYEFRGKAGRIEILRQLATLGHKESAPLILKLAKGEETEEVLLYAVELLRDHRHEPAREFLESLQKGESETVRARAFSALVALKLTEKELKTALADKSAALRALGVWQLPPLRLKDAPELLRAALRDPAREVRSAALFVTRLQRVDALAEDVAAFAESGRVDDESSQAVAALAEMGTRRARKILARLLLGPKVHGQIRRRIEPKLAALKSVDLIEDLLAGLESESGPIRSAALRVLGEISLLVGCPGPLPFPAEGLAPKASRGKENLVDGRLDTDGVSFGRGAFVDLEWDAPVFVHSVVFHARSGSGAVEVFAAEGGDFESAGLCWVLPRAEGPFPATAFVGRKAKRLRIVATKDSFHLIEEVSVWTCGTEDVVGEWKAWGRRHRKSLEALAAEEKSLEDLGGHLREWKLDPADGVCERLASANEAAFPVLGRAYVALLKGKLVEAFDFAERALRREERAARAHAVRAYAMADLREPKKARAAADRALEGSRGDPASHLADAAAHMASGDLDSALSSVERAIRLGLFDSSSCAADVRWLDLSELFKGLRSDARYAAMLKRLRTGS